MTTQANQRYRLGASLAAKASRLPRQVWVNLYTTLISFAGLSVILLALLDLPADRTGFLIYVGMGVLTELLSVELFSSMRGSRVSAAAIISLAGMLTFGPLPGALINTACGLAASLVSAFANRGKDGSGRASLMRRSSFNIGMLTISTTLAGYTYTAFGGLVGDPIHLSNTLPLFIAVLVSEASNILLLLGVITLQTGQPPMQVWEQNLRWGVPISVVGGGLGSFAVAVAHNQFGLLGLALFFLPIVAIGYSFRLYMTNMRTYVNRLEQANTEMDQINTSLLETISSVIDAYDLYTYGHSAQVAIYTAAIAEKLNLSQAEKATLSRAALVHDIGKIGVTDNITGKAARLTEEERYMMERHPIIGADILRRMKGLQDLVPLVRHHHEKWDGSGYPAGLAGGEIPRGARIIALADAVDAMCSSRPYRKALKIEDVLNEVKRSSGKHFDPQVVAAFLAVAAEHDQAYFRDSAEIIDENILSDDLRSKIQGLRYLKRSMLPE